SRLRSSALFLDRCGGYEALDALRAKTTTSAHLERIREAVIRRDGLELAAAVSKDSDAEELAHLCEAALSAWAGSGREPAFVADEAPERPRSSGRVWSQTGAFNAQAYRMPGIPAATGPATAVAFVCAGDHVRREVATKGTAYGA